MVLLGKIILLCHLLPFVRTINTIFLPCDTDMKTTTVDCSERRLKLVPNIKSTTVVSLNLSLTKIQQVGERDFSGLPNLMTLIMTGNCQPGGLRPLNEHSCELDFHYYALKGLSNLSSLNLSGNSLRSIPWLPESLKVLNLQSNQIFHITHRLGVPLLEELYLNSNCFYANPCYQSFYISEEVFRELTKLKHLELGYNNLTAIPKGLPISLESLDLKENTIAEILDYAFSKLTVLNSLNLEWNCQRCDHAARPCFPCPNNLPLQLFENSLYAENSSIKYLNLRGNSLKNIPDGLFMPLKNLTNLDLSDNLLAYAIQNGTFFSELTGLQWISLIYNYEPLTTFTELDLSPHIGNISGLKYILLSGNFFRTLSNESFQVLSKLRNLKTIELRMNFIAKFDFNALKQIPSLNEIVISQNKLNFLQCSSSLAVRREFLSRSDIWESNHSNRLKTYQDDMSLWMRFCQNKNIYDLSQNDIMSLSQNTFVGMEKAVCLDLSFNYMDQAFHRGEFNRMKNLVYLNLSHNRLDLYYNTSFSELSDTLKVLDLSYNEFQFKMKGMGHQFRFIQGLANLEILSLAGNDIGTRIDFKLFSSSLKCLYFYGNHLDLMWDTGNNKYTHFFQDLTNLTYLDISDNKLRSISPEVLCNLPVSLQILIISNNGLSYFPWQNISALSNLKHLDLSQNLITSLPLEVIEFGPLLDHLDLSQNNIHLLPEVFFRKTSSLRYLFLNGNSIKELNQQFLPAPFKTGSGLKKLTLHNNPFKCDCNSAWLAIFLCNTTITIPYLTTHVRCEFPESQQGESILSMDQHSCQDIYGSIASLITAFLVVAFTVLPILNHRYGWDLWYCLQVLWAGHKGYSNLAGTESPYDYDAFVVFNTSNHAVTDWVYNELTVHLENSGHRRFCLCLEERDWIPGLSHIDNLHNAVCKSVKTVFVLSSGSTGNGTINGMIRQAFFMVQQRLLDEQVDAAVLILLDDMFPKMKYLQLRKRLCRKSVLSWPKNPKAQPLFWNQLKIVLSSDNLKFYDNNMSESFM